jgi:hypothetical protein
MINSAEIYEIKTQSDQVEITQTNFDFRFRGNQAYGKVLGINVMVINNTGVADYSNDIKVSIREVGGSNRVLLNAAPYNLVKHSPNVKFEERFLSFEGVSGNNCDLSVYVETPTRGADILTATVTVLYSKNK